MQLVKRIGLSKSYTFVHSHNFYKVSLKANSLKFLQEEQQTNHIRSLFKKVHHDQWFVLNK